MRERNRRAVQDAADTTLASGQPARPRRSWHRADAEACGTSPASTEPPHRGRETGRCAGRTCARRYARSPSALVGPIPGSNCRTRKPARASRGFSAQRRIASRSLTCAASINLSPPYLTNGMLRPASSISSRPLWCEVRNKRLVAQIDPGLAVLQDLVGDIGCLRHSSLDGHQGQLGRRFRRGQCLGEAFSGSGR